MHYVLLVNREVGLSQDIYPVCGKSGKCYGQATKDAPRGGVAFKLSIEDYERDKWDILGNRNFQQTWVPEFIEVEALNPQPQIVTGDGLDALKWHELTKIGKSLGVFKVGITRAFLTSLIRDRQREAA
jgi:hypothetical protein